MKRIILLFTISVLSSTLSFGQKKYEMVVEKTDGTESVFNTEDVARTYFRERNGGDDTSCPDSNHPHLIDLGLPSGTKWACCNVGAKKPEEFGGYYAWGDTEEKSWYDWSTYIYCDGSLDSFHDLGSDISGTKYDVAHVKWGGSWVMPSHEQQLELLNNCTSTWTKVNDVNGRKFTSMINGKTIFLPAAGNHIKGELCNVLYGFYWAAKQGPGNSYYAFCIAFRPGEIWWDHIDRSVGQSVRPVVRSYH